MKKFLVFSISFIVILLAGCSLRTSAGTPVTTMPNPETRSTLTLEETSFKQYEISDFEAVHSPVNGDANEHLIFGNLSVTQPSADTPADLAVFLGRWEGYSYAPPVKKDRKLVLHIAEISEQGGRLYGWSGTNLQFPDIMAEAHFRVVREKGIPTIEFQSTWKDGSSLIDRFTYDPEKQVIHGELLNAGSRQQADVYDLTCDRTFYVYKDYGQYLAGKNITTHSFRAEHLGRYYGKGYMLYLPDGYEADLQKKWPLIFFLHGSGDRGDNLQILAKASPFMYIRQKGPLEAIIAAPLLSADVAYSLFPVEYLDGALDEIRADYRVDASRIYLTGLSLGGEATYRFALHRPETFAAIAPLCAFLNDANVESMKKIKDIPVWAFHGADDTVVKPSWGQQPADALKQAGGNVKFSLLPNHDHDVWTDTYTDPAFYAWLFDQQKP